MNIGDDKNAFKSPLTLIFCLGLSFWLSCFQQGNSFEGNKTAISYKIAPVLVSPEKNRKHSNNDVNFSTVDKGAMSGISSSERLAIKEESVWLSVWNKHARGKTVSPVVPSIDFDRDMVLAVFQGEKSGSSNLVCIERVRLFKDKMVVLLGHRSVGTDSTRTTLRSYHIVKLPKNNLPVVFH